MFLYDWAQLSFQSSDCNAARGEGVKVLMESNNLQLQRGTHLTMARFRVGDCKIKIKKNILLCILFAESRALLLHLIVISFHYKRLKWELAFVWSWKGRIWDAQWLLTRALTRRRAAAAAAEVKRLVLRGLENKLVFSQEVAALLHIQGQRRNNTLDSAASSITRIHCASITHDYIQPCKIN